MQKHSMCWDCYKYFALCIRDKLLVLGIITNYSQLSPVVFMGQDTLLSQNKITVYVLSDAL